jgi:hypothetical protein
LIELLIVFVGWLGLILSNKYIEIRLILRIFSNQLLISFCIFVQNASCSIAGPIKKGKRKVRATQSISLPNGKRFRTECLSYGKCRRKHTADGFLSTGKVENVR